MSEIENYFNNYSQRIIYSSLFHLSFFFEKAHLLCLLTSTFSLHFYPFLSSLFISFINFFSFLSFHFPSSFPITLHFSYLYLQSKFLLVLFSSLPHPLSLCLSYYLGMELLEINHWVGCW
jgi:hypothetical protein